MSNVLAIGFLALLYLHAAGALKCLECKKVAQDNNCKHKEKTCSARLWRFCYSRLKVEGATSSVDRGCSVVCRSVKNMKSQRDEKMMCCVRNLCNTHNMWHNK
ncbi:Hypothetical predicted protein [Podarcis lilfordi]|nr:Hypothetical predicted protein [Podarcis lilfordi]